MTASGSVTVAPSVPADDESLARRCAARDPAAFELVMRHYNRRLFRVARAVLKDDDEAQDVVQDAYIAAFRAIGDFRGTARLSTWLTRIVLNEAYGRLRRRKREARVVALDPYDRVALQSDAAMPSAGHDDDPERQAVRAELRRLLERHIDALPEQFRAAFMLREVEELSVEEAAACLQVAEATVRTRAFRARALLREALARELDVATLDAFGFAGERCDRIVAHVLRALAEVDRDFPNHR
jgi:RNA polymerase sigma-70 factor, ECF subfamily